MDAAIVDYGAGNVFSVATALERLGARVTVTADEKKIRDASRVVFPGVGQASAAMEHLKNTGLDALIPRLTQPVLGICLGMQLMCRRTEEGDTAGLGIFPLAVERFPEGPVKLKVPHMGWNTVEGLRTGLFEGIVDGSRMYFVHSYFVPDSPDTAARTVYGQSFASAVARDNFFGCQFHPEKSSAAGRRVLENFLAKDLEKRIG